MISFVASTQSSSVIAAMTQFPLPFSFTSRGRTALAGLPVWSPAVATASARFAASSFGFSMVTVPLPKSTRKLGRLGAAWNEGNEGHEVSKGWRKRETRYPRIDTRNNTTRPPRGTYPRNHDASVLDPRDAGRRGGGGAKHRHRRAGHRATRCGDPGPTRKPPVPESKQKEKRSSKSASFREA
jgi:hypothetical protein